MTAGNQPSSSSVSKSAFDICVMIVEEECYLDALPAEGDNYERAMHEVGLAIRDRIRCAQQEASGGAQASLPPLVDRGGLVALLEDLASVNLSREAVERQARRIADDLIARGLTLSAVTPSPGPGEDWSERLAERVMQLQAAGAETLTCAQVLGLIAFVRDGEGSAVTSTNSGGAAK